MEKSELMTIMEMMDYLKISRKTAYTLAASGKLPIYRISPRKTMLKKSDIDFYVNQCKKQEGAVK